MKQLLRRAMKMAVKRHPNLRSVLVEGYVRPSVPNSPSIPTRRLTHHNPPATKTHAARNRGLKAVPFSRCPKVKVPRVESDDVVAWTEELLNNSTKCVRRRLCPLLVIRTGGR